MTVAARPRADDQTASSNSIEEALRAFTKAFRAWQLYLPNNPTRERAIDVACSAFASCWATDATELRLQVREAAFVHEGRLVLREQERQSDGIPWILYRDGIRELTIRPGFEREELAEVLAVLQRARQAAPDDDDLVTMLWIADLETVSYRYVDVASSYEVGALAAAASGGSLGGGGASAAEAAREPLAVPAAESPSVGDGPPPGIVRVEDFDSTLYFLDKRELAYLQEEVRAEFGSDPRRGVLAVLFDLVEIRLEQPVRREVIDRVDELMVDLLATGSYDLVAYALQEAQLAARRAPELQATERDRLLAIADQLSQPEVVAQLLQAVDEGARALPAGTLETLVAELRGAALAPLVAWLSQSAGGASRAVVERAVLQLAERQTADLVRLVEDADPDTARGAMRLAGQMRTAAAVPALSRLLRSATGPQRTEVVQALSAIGSPGAMQAIEPVLDDEGRDVRVHALRAVMTQRHAPALPRLTAALKRRELRTADRSDKTALFDAYGTLCGDAGVGLLDGMLNGRSLLGPRESSEMRACAARALALVGSASAVASLRKAADSRDAVVRNEVARALRGGPG